MTTTLTAARTAPTIATTVITATPAPPQPIRLRCLAPRHAERVRLLALRAGLVHAGDAIRPGPDPHDRRAVTVVVADDVEQALRGAREPGPLLVVCDTVTRAGLMLAVRAGAVVLRAADLGEETLSAAVHRAGHPHQSIPYPVLSQLLTTDPRQRSSGEEPALTPRQTSVLRLMADGHHNADIARLLSCSEHTVKNVIYDVMSRLHARNRAHAVAHAVRHGLI
ncbi:LuxR family transcriptional regulator [Streptomyces sp. NPDC017615]|uniref:LuxR family transcriptional regulator n=1 Tax=Streptomyces sp. NPDC017615 TaxID=3365003 RepID=UPI0037A76CD1